MIYNDTLKSSYGEFEEITSTASIKSRRSLPSQEEYDAGYISRFFAKKANENVIIEIDYDSVSSINSFLYKVVKVDWKITGPRNNTLKNGILDRAGVTEQNKFEIERVKKEEGVDLSSTLPNLLEYWRGR
jgi:hypothetical protein